MARALVVTLFLLLTVVEGAFACPSCKETVAADNGGLATGLSYSVLGMVSMPFLLFAVVGGIVAIAYRRARQRGEGEPPI